MKKIFTIIIFLIFFSFTFNSLSAKNIQTNNKSNFEYMLIHIDGNDEFTRENGVIRGSGTKFDPYIMENYQNLKGIIIEHTDKYVVIQNCKFISNCYYEYDEGENYWEEYASLIFNNVKNATVIDSNFQYTGTGEVGGITIIDSDYNNFKNIFVDINYITTAIHLMSSYHNDFINCECSGIENSWGFLVKSSIYNKFIDCTIKNSGISAIEMMSCVDNTIDNCKINNNRFGINLFFSDKNNILNSEIKNNGEGIELEYSDKNIVNGCDFVGNDISILSGGDHPAYAYKFSNTFYQNNFFDDENLIYIILEKDNWDKDGTGNYWKDYNGVDKDFDGIGDSSYKVAALNFDNYPMMNPYSNQGNPTKPQITGSISGEINNNYDYSYLSYDPNGKDIYYYIDWNDGSESGWLGPYESGEEITVSHSWEYSGSYIIGEKAKNINNFESEWSSYRISMPKNKNIITKFIRFLDEKNIITKILVTLF